MSPIDDADVAVFESERSRLIGLAYRMLGSLTDAEDVVSDAWFRYQRADRSEIDRPAAWLTTVTSRLAIDRLRSLTSRREDYVGPWLPEPVPTAATGSGSTPVLARGADGLSITPEAAPDPAERAELSESLTLGFLVVLDRLSPIERAVFLLADVFGEPFPEISRTVGRSPEACRQIAVRARRRVRDERAGCAAADEQLLGALVAALAVGDARGVIDLLAPDVVLTSDGGPDRHAARRPVVGAARVLRFLLNLTARIPEGAEMEIRTVNAAPALVVRHPDGPIVVSADRDEGGHVAAIRMQMNPDRSAGIDAGFPVL